jgi:hypothetical protein
LIFIQLLRVLAVQDIRFNGPQWVLYRLAKIHGHPDLFLRRCSGKPDARLMALQ